MDALWQDGQMSRRPSGEAMGWSPVRVGVELGYGWGLLHGRGQVMPFGRWGLEGGSSHRVNVGMRVVPAESLTNGGCARLLLDLSGEQVSQPPMRRISLIGSISF